MKNNKMVKRGQTAMENLRAFTHHHWGSIVGNEKDIRLAVIKDELELWNNRVKRTTKEDSHIYLLAYFEGRCKELENGRLSGK